MTRKPIYVNEKSSVEIEYSEEESPKVTVYIDGSEHVFEDETTEDAKVQYAFKTKKNKYSEFLSYQFDNLVFLTGAGSSCGIGVDDKKGQLMSGLWNEAVSSLGQDKIDRFCNLVKYTYKETKEDGSKVWIKNLEKLLSLADLAKDFVEDPQPDDKVDIKEMIHDIKELIKDKCNLELPEDAPHSLFLSKITKRKTSLPRVKIFTLNYDTLFEQAALKGNFTVIDGFSYSYPRYFSGRNFDYDIVVRYGNRIKKEDNFVNRVFHLYKPHGSVNWKLEGDEIAQAKPNEINVDESLMIYPQSNKYEHSYEQPFFEMMSRFQQVLRQDNVMLITIGFSFGDKHIVTAIKEALEQNPGFQLMVVNKGIETDGQMKWLYKLAKEHSNIVLVDELFADFAKGYPDTTIYDQDEYKLIKIQK